jgi:hypothetical protein
LDVHWVGHPNWYFRISKHSLPFLRTAHTSAAFFADEFPAGESLANYVLKPLYSFAGLGVEMERRPKSWPPSTTRMPTSCKRKSAMRSSSRRSTVTARKLKCG